MVSNTPAATPLPDLPAWLWLGAPALVVLLPYALRPFGLDGPYRYVYFEWGIIENLTVLFLLVAIAAGWLLFRAGRGTFAPWLRGWVLLLTLGCIYFAGEELSWGQHLLGWQTPEPWREINLQQETNLHNTIPLLDQVPRALLSLMTLIGGVLVPLYRLVTRRYPPPASSRYWLWPTIVCLPAALAALTVTLPGKLAEAGHIALPAALDIDKVGESKECLLALVLMLYLGSMYVRRRALVRTADYRSRLIRPTH